MKRRLMALIMVVVVGVWALAGCGSQEKKNNNANSAENAQSTPDAGKQAKNEKTEHIKILMAGTEQPDQQRVVDAMNKLLQEKLNMTIEISMVNFGNYKQQCQLALSGGDDYDVVMIMGSLAANYLNAGYIYELSDLIDKYGKDIIAAMPDTAKAIQMNGKMFGIPMNRDYVQQFSIVMRTDLIKKYGIDTSKIKSLDDMTPVFETVKAKEPDMTMFITQSSSNGYPNQYVWYDQLDNYCGVLMDPKNSTKVTNLFESDEYMDYSKLMYAWNQKGYMLKDGATNTESKQSMMKSGTCFSFPYSYTPTAEVELEQSAGYDLTVVPLEEPMALTSQISTFSWGISSSCENPEKAMEFLNFAYTSPEFNNLLNWGEEGKDYVFEDKDKGIINYPEGVDSKTSGYHLNLGWEIPNEFLTYLWSGSDPDTWVNFKSFNEQSFKSEAFGFVFDSTPVTNEMAAISNVLGQYVNALTAGSAEPEATIKKMNQDLKKAGIDTVIQEKQKQLDAFISNK
ncbi:putative aldouronate transport system substrate-binding protein [Anaerocolumna jejuensis DSM 15929]|uniref:Putative aldouronate transport system substrate-binding protein n=1 Tax=Anaerocolumna jejuensis DSM 15929 TaxID=1121322 RepID=A0A1M6Z7M0_9FIRM|nr:ABC transporter substrate-binding protein [Anaerocolumna jejuensis]SHL26329.1 putative aldouronate transport system substrate-binding protein [Anaerocolumna jejuensis DSM 15929]